MAGNTIPYTKSYQPAETTNIASLSCTLYLRQPTAGATTAPQFKLQCTVTPRSGASASCRVSVNFGIYGESDHAGVSVTCTSTSSTATYDSGWVTAPAYIEHSTGTDTWYAQFYCNASGAGSLSGTFSGKIYWTQSVTTYGTVTYNANGGSSTPSSQTFAIGQSVKLAAAISRTNYSFAGWNTNSSGTGTTYTAGSWYSFSGNITLYAKWTSSSGGGGSTSNTTLKIYCTNSNDVCYASTSAIMGTAASSNGTRTVTLSCTSSGVSMKPMRISYLPDPNGVRYANSMALLVEWWNPNSNTYYCNQEVIFAPSTASKGAKWTDHASSSRVLDQNTVWSDQPTQIDVVASSTGSTSGATVTKATLNDYYISGVGTSNGTSSTSMGSYNNPAIWYSRYENATSASDSTQVGTPKYYRKLSWTKPSSGTPLYYVIVYWKGYSTSDVRNGELSEVVIANGNATSVLLTSNYWQAGFGKYLKLTVHAVYSDGINPQFSTAKAGAGNGVTYGMGQSTVETWALWWRMYYPPASYNIKFYEKDKSTLLVDSNGSAYDYYIPNGAAISAPADIRISGDDNSDSYNITGWYKKTGTGAWGTSAITSLGSMGTQALSFAQVISKKTYTITYTNTSGSTATATINHGDAIIIDNANGSAATTRRITANYTIQAPTKSGYKFKGYLYDSSSHTFEATWISDKNVYIYDSSTGTWKKYKPYIYTGSAWKSATYFIYTNDNEGWV